MATDRIIPAALALTLIATVVALAGCPQPPVEEPPVIDMPREPTGERPAGGGEGETIKLIGSTTVLPIATAWAKAYAEVAPDVSVNVAGGGSGSGIEALINGTADIGDASRAIKDSEMERARAAGVEPVEHVIAYDGIAAVVHPSNPASQLTLQQLSDIYSGQVTQWSEVGVDGVGEITVVGRDASSGTYGSWEELVVQAEDDTREYTVAMLQMQSNETVRSTVASTPGAIGYIGLGYLDDTVRTVPVVPLDGGDAVAPTEATVADGSYPISRELYMYTRGRPTGIIRAFLDWGMSEAGQKLVAEEGFVPVD